MNLQEEVLSHFNEPVLMHLEVARVIGYAEDARDCYLIIRYPAKVYGEEGKIVYHTCVGGYHWLDRLKGQSYVKSTEGEDWDDLIRISGDLTRYGCPEEKEPIIDIQPDDDSLYTRKE